MQREPTDVAEIQANRDEGEIDTTQSWQSGIPDAAITLRRKIRLGMVDMQPLSPTKLLGERLVMELLSMSLPPYLCAFATVRLDAILIASPITENCSRISALITDSRIGYFLSKLMLHLQVP